MNTPIEAAANPRATDRTGALALALQEAFTVAVRLRANRQVAADAASFRAQVKTLLASADRDARAHGYDPEYVKLAVYAYIAFLDETVLNSTQAMFSAWTRQPLQEEVFGEHMAGENFFRYLTDLLGRQDSAELADLLEVYSLCLLLGFRGKYAAGDPANLQGLAMAVQQKLQRIRGPRGMPRAWVLPENEVIASAADPWVRRLRNAAAGAFAVALVLYGLYRLLLGGQAGRIRDGVAQLIGG
jgi:type VI secretion system protein ImpK